ncbi:26S proteasome non-ATPase regulatory subunit 10-like [Hyalella azteca]|uniref:26S proteasome non-ATPase regulatory subunit 10-like n=1 Tax=Hyalella azteca TaxID=294128 RepID=A0A8B7N016_HYAAZ|nr:26S proteasome non-ATPase regulatory subunit 10-like [Hyalella azteca]
MLGGAAVLGGGSRDSGISGSLDSIPVNSVDSNGRTALHMAAYGNSVAAARLLLAAGANTEAYDITGSGALQAAVASGRVHLVTLLLENEASVGHEDKYGNTALHYACLLAPSKSADTILSAILTKHKHSHRCCCHSNICVDIICLC